MRSRVTAFVIFILVAVTLQIGLWQPSDALDKPYVPAAQKYKPVEHRELKRDWKRPAVPGIPKTLKARGALPSTWGAIVTAQPSNPLKVETINQAGGWKGKPLVKLASNSKSKSKTGLSGRYRVALVDSTTVKKLGMPGLVFSVVAEPGSDEKAELTVDYSELVKIAGLDWASRLQLVTLPACALTTPDRAACQTVTPLTSDNDEAKRQVSADVPTITSGDTARATTQATNATLVAAVAGTGGSQGNYTATDLQPSGSWSQGGAAGSFNWSYPITTAAPAAGNAPAVELSYNSATVDGLNSNTNPQSSWVGTGFNYQPGYIERTYRNCKEANTASTDKGLCWAGDILTMYLPGGATQALVVDSTTGQIRPEGDGGEKVERLTGAANGSVNGEYWRVTTTDGTKYTFGANILPGGTTATATKAAWNVPVYGGTSTDGCAAKRCARTWRWNLDMVEDTHKNVAAYSYTNETNYFVPSGTTTRTLYDRGGFLKRIDYGITNNGTSIYGVANPPHRITFSVAERCNPTGTITCTDAQFVVANAKNWPDVPVDQNCTASGGTCIINTPTFWTRKKLTNITTSYFSGTAYTNVDAYALTHTWSQSTSTASLDLATVKRTGTAAGNTVTLPQVSFAYATLDNRVKDYKALPDMGYDRLTRIVTETGADIAIVYNSMDPQYADNAPGRCISTTVPSEPHDNNTLCFPVNWTQPYTTTPTLDYFHKYVVVAVSESDPNGLTPTTHTEYNYNNANWHYDDNEIIKPAQRTWSEWRGYRTVETSTGDPNWNSHNGTADQTTRAKTTYYTGMEGDKLPSGTRTHDDTKFNDSRGIERTDSNQFAGLVVEKQTYDGTTEITSSRAFPKTLAATATRTRSGMPALVANVVAVDETITVTNGIGSATSDLVSTTTTEYGGPTGEPYIKRPIKSRVTATGGTGTSNGTCTTTSYADNTTTWVRNAPAEISVFADTCESGSELVSLSRNYYDLKTASGGANVTAGDLTKTESAIEPSGTTFRYATNTATFDTRGRLTTQTEFPDGAATTSTARTTTYGYTISAGLVLTGTTTTLPAMPGVTGPITSTQTFDPARGALISSKDPAGRITSSTIDGLGRYTAVWRPGRPQATASASATYAYQLTTGAPLALTTKSIVDVGNGTTPTYDTRVAIFDAFGTLRQTQTDATSSGRVITDSFVDSHRWTVATNNRWYTTGAPSTTVIATGEGNVDSRTLTRYDRTGRPTVVQNWRGAEPQPVTTTSTIYGGDRTTVIPPSGAIASTSLMNGLGQATELRRYTEPVTAASFNGAEANKTQYTYGADGNLSGFTTATGTNKSANWNYNYDLLGRQVQSQDPDSGTSSSHYDATGAVISTTDAAGREVSTTYDTWGRPIDRYTGSAAGIKIASWKYDTLVVGELTSSTALVPDEGTGPTRTFTNTVVGYTPQGIPTGTDLTLNVPGLLPKYSTRSTYTSTGLPSSLTLAATLDSALNQGKSTEKLTYWYDRLGQQNGLTGTNGYLTNAVYTPYRESSQYVLGVNSATTGLSYTRDPHNRWITNTKLTGQLASPQVANTAVTRDAVGNITRVIDTHGADGAPTQTTCYNYDELQQLTDAWAATDACASGPDTAPIGGVDPFRQHWTYDEAGSRTSQTAYTLPGQTGGNAITTYTNGVTGHAHALASSNTTGATDPANIGVRVNLPASLQATYTETGATSTVTTPDGETGYGYRPDGSLAAITAPDGDKSEYIRDAEGNRLLRIDEEDGTTTTTLYLPGQQVTAKSTSGSTTLTTVRSYSLVDGQQIAVRKNNANPVFTLADAHGTNQLTYDPFTTPTNPPVTRRAFDPYGNELSTDASTPWIDDRTFLNKPANPITNLVDIGAREYDPATGRFTSVDPLLDPASPTQANGYNYANNNPITYSDPTGLRPACVDLSGCGDRGSGVLSPDPLKPGVWVSYLSKPSSTKSSFNLGAILPDINKMASGARNILIGTIQGAGGTSSNPVIKQAALDASGETLATGHAEFDPEFTKTLLLILLFIPVGGPGANVSARATLTAAERAIAQRATAGTVRAATEGTATSVDIAGARFAQTRFTESFQKRGLFEGRTIDDVAGGLRSGAMSPKDVPIDVIVRGGNTLILNTRSSQALIRAGVPRSSWNVIDRTGQAAYEGRLSDQLTRNKLTNYGTELP